MVNTVRLLWLAVMCDLDAIRTVRSRGIFMEHDKHRKEAVAMSAVLGMDAEVIEDVLKWQRGRF